MTRLTKNQASATTPVAGALPGLTITATPIGNLGDLSARARASLEDADIIACEDTRHTGLMLSRLGVRHGKRIAYHDHSSAAVDAGLIKAMRDGAAVTLVSDAGTPVLSDPGFRLVRACQAEGIPVRAVPGASALLAALVVSGLPADRFVFAGFLPSQAKRRREELNALLALPMTLIFYESPKRLLASLGDLDDLAPQRAIVVARELTKRHEETRRGTAAELLEHYAGLAPKGEIVLLIGPADAPDAALDDAAVLAMLERALADGLSRRDAARLVSETTGIARTTVYGLALQLDLPAGEDT